MFAGEGMSSERRMSRGGGEEKFADVVENAFENNAMENALHESVVREMSDKLTFYNNKILSEREAAAALLEKELEAKDATIKSLMQALAEEKAKQVPVPKEEREKRLSDLQNNADAVAPAYEQFAADMTVL